MGSLYFIIRWLVFMFRDKMMRFMVGRNGVDQLGRATTWLALLLMLTTMLTHSAMVYLLALLLIIYSYFRMMSRNISKRYLENQKYLQITDRIRPFLNKVEFKMQSTIRKVANWFSQRKYYRFYKCPNCHQKLRVPKGHGKIEITCKRFSTRFIKKS